MKNQIVNIGLILVAASIVFTLFWKPVRSRNNFIDQDDGLKIASIQNLEVSNQNIDISATSLDTLENEVNQILSFNKDNSSFNIYPDTGTTNEAGVLLKFFHMLCNQQLINKSESTEILINKILTRLVADSNKTFTEIQRTQKQILNHPSVEANMMKVVMKLNITREQKAIYYRSIFKRNYLENSSERNLILKKNTPEARNYLNIIGADID